jgi:hypothetical protein
VAVVALPLIVVAALEAPESVWPVSVVGWLGLAISAGTLVTFLWQRARKEERDRQRIAASERILNEFRRSVERQMNGFGKRVERLEDEAVGDRTVVNGVLQSIATLTADVKHSSDTSDRIERKLEKIETALTRHAPPTPP